MVTVYLLCGKICCGKSTFAEEMKTCKNAVILSCDKLVFALFEGNLDDKHDEMLIKVKKYLINLALDILKTGKDVILDWGFWKEEDRISTKKIFSDNNIDCVLYYIKISDNQWYKNINDRNNGIKSGLVKDNYIVDKGLLEKAKGLFEEPINPDITYTYGIE